MSAEAQRPLLPAARQQALEWLVVLWSGEATAAEHQGLASWRAADTEHERAWQQVQGLRCAMQEVPSTMGQELRSRPVPAKRRQLLRSIVALSIAGAAGYGATRSEAWLAWHANYRTARNERRELTLPDGTVLTLNGGSAVDLRFDADARRLVLHTGEIMVRTAHEDGPYRPFSVLTHHGEARALGTQFTVRSLDRDATEVAVFQGAVAVTPRAGGAGQVLQLEAGQAAQFDARQVLRRFAADPLRAAWSRGLLVADRMRMADFVAELARYRYGVLRCDPAASELIVSGVYPLADTDAVLDSLAQALPIRIGSILPWWVTITKK